MVTSSQYKGKIFRIILRTLLWMLLIPCALIVLLVAAIQFKGVQTFITSKVTGYLSSKIHSTVRLGEANVSFRGGIVLSELYIEDLQKDTLIYSEKFTVDVDLFRLLSHVVIVRSVEAAHMRLNLHRPANDTVFNYQFIVNAFSGEAKQEAPEQDTSSGSWAISLNRISLQTISLAYHDVYGGTVADVFIGDLATTFREFDLEKEIILAKDLKLENSSVAVSLHKSSRPEKSDSSASVKYLLGVDDTQIYNIRIIYSDQVAGSHLKGVVGELSVRSNSVHLGKMEVSTGKLSLKNSQLAYTSSERDTTVKEIVKEVAESDTDPVDWKINLSGLELDA
jgi:translocation and assembly module TamB